MVWFSSLQVVSKPAHLGWLQICALACELELQKYVNLDTPEKMTLFMPWNVPKTSCQST